MPTQFAKDLILEHIVKDSACLCDKRDDPGATVKCEFTVPVVPGCPTAAPQFIDCVGAISFPKKETTPDEEEFACVPSVEQRCALPNFCLVYTSDAADE